MFHAIIIIPAPPIHEFSHNAERRIMRHGQIDGRQRLIAQAAGSA
jgi:hypothetical protein